MIRYLKQVAIIHFGRLPNSTAYLRCRSWSAPLASTAGYCFVRIELQGQSQSALATGLACRADDALFRHPKETSDALPSRLQTDAREADRIAVVFLSWATCRWRSCLFLSSSSDPPCSLTFWLDRWRHTVIWSPDPWN